MTNAQIFGYTKQQKRLGVTSFKYCAFIKPDACIEPSLALGTKEDSTTQPADHALTVRAAITSWLDVFWTKKHRRPEELDHQRYLGARQGFVDRSFGEHSTTST